MSTTFDIHYCTPGTDRCATELGDLLHRPTGLLTYLLVHIAATEENRAELAVNVFGSITNCTWTVQLYSPGCANVHLHVTWAHPSPHPKRHLDRLSRFAGLTIVAYRPTDSPRYSARNNRPHLRT